MYFQETYIWVESGVVGKILYRLFLFFPYMESIVQFSTIENPMNCKVFKVNLIEKLIEKLKLAQILQFLNYVL